MNQITIKLTIALQSKLEPHEMLEKFQNAMNTLCSELEKELPAKGRFITYRLGDTFSDINLES